MKNVFKLLISLCLMLSFVASAKEVKFIHITDINLNEKNAHKLQETIKEINSYDDVDFVVFGGNNIAKADIKNLNTFCYLLKKVKKKAYVLLGSNDVLSSSGIDKEYYLKRINRVKKYHSKNPNYIFEKQGYVFIAMDGAKQYFQSPNGYYNKQELKFLEDNLKKYQNKNVIILQHFPLIENSSKWLETAKIEEYQEILDKYKNTKVIISGHYGKNQEVKKDEIYHIITESYSKSCAYKIIEIDLDYDFIATYLVRN